VRRDAQAGGEGRLARAHRIVAVGALALVALVPRAARAQQLEALRAGRFTILAADADRPLARTLLGRAQAADTFPGLPRPREEVVIAIAPDARRFREWSGAGAPDWGAAIAIPAERRIVLQGSSAGSDAGDPLQALRHELAHLALHESMGDLPPRWFDEGYASWCAREWSREDLLAASLGLLLHGVPPLDSLDAGFTGGAVRAGMAYALSYRAVADLAALDTARGLTVFFDRWRAHGRMDRAMREAFGLTEERFEREWRARTFRRYGLAALVANLGALAALFGLIVAPVWVSKRRRDRMRLEAMRQTEAAAERAARDSAIQSLLASSPEAQKGSDAERMKGP